jgi:hypothetical protein
MPETQAEETKEKEQKALVFVGHYHHVAECKCKTVTTVESYYKQLPDIICPSCQITNPITTTIHDDPFVSDNTMKCSECSCRFMSVPYPQNATCPTCNHPMVKPHATRPPS